jgi:low affinity Fe/Cu permease
MANGNGKSGVSAAHRVFSKIANGVAHATGRPGVFMLALLAVLVWAITGPFFRYSDTWQLVINTGTTIVTFFMVFLIQNSQNRDSAAIQVKLDELRFRSESLSRYQSNLRCLASLGDELH